MAYREVSRVEIAEVVRRWQSGISQRRISTGTGLSRATDVACPGSNIGIEVKVY